MVPVRQSQSSRSGSRAEENRRGGRSPKIARARRYSSPRGARLGNLSATRFRFETAPISDLGLLSVQEGGQVSWQQEAIISKMPAQASWSESWTPSGKADPPRGFAFSSIRLGGSEIAFYCVHLKSNLVRGDSERVTQTNIAKRERATAQLMDHVRGLHSMLPLVKGIVIGGDLNTNKDQSMFVSEQTLDLLSSSGFKNCFSVSAPLAERITHPGHGKYPDATFDYIFSRGLERSGCRISQTSVSDHFPVTCDLQIESSPHEN